MLKIRRSRDRLMFNMGIPILVRQHHYIETPPASTWFLPPSSINMTFTHSLKCWNNYLRLSDLESWIVYTVKSVISGSFVYRQLSLYTCTYFRTMGPYIDIQLHPQSRVECGYIFAPNSSLTCASYSFKEYPDSKVHGANMGPIWGRQDPGGPHVGPMNFAIWDSTWKTWRLSLELLLIKLILHLKIIHDGSRWWVIRSNQETLHCYRLLYKESWSKIITKFHGELCEL